MCCYLKLTIGKLLKRTYTVCFHDNTEDDEKFIAWFTQRCNGALSMQTLPLLNKCSISLICPLTSYEGRPHGLVILTQKETGACCLQMGS